MPHRSGPDKSAAPRRCAATKRPATLSSPRLAQNAFRGRLAEPRSSAGRNHAHSGHRFGASCWPEEVLIEAYRERAIEVCRKQSAKTPHAAAGTKDLWGSDSEAEVLIGNPGVDVAIWDTQNPRWEERFRHPNLILTGAGETPARCAYDLRDGVATLSTR